MSRVARSSRARRSGPASERSIRAVPFGDKDDDVPSGRTPGFEIRKRIAGEAIERGEDRRRSR